MSAGTHTCRVQDASGCAVARARIVQIAAACAVALASAACAGGERQQVPAPAPSLAPSSSAATPRDVTVRVGGGFWSPRLRAVSLAVRMCGADGARPGAPMTERAIFDALASLSLDGAALQADMPATCATSCMRPAWTGADARACESLAALAALDTMIWRVSGGDAPSVAVALIADSEISFICGDVRWHIDQGTDYPWSGHVGFTVSHRVPGDEAAPHPDSSPSSAPQAQREAASSQGPEPQASGAASNEPAVVQRPLDVRLLLPEWLDPASVRVSARGRMLAGSDLSVDGRTLTVRGPWSDGDRMHVSFPMPPRRVATASGIEIWRGPLRYVAEAADQPGASLSDTTLAPGDGLRDVPYMLGALSPRDAAAQQGDPVTQRPTPEPDAAANSAPNGIMAVMVERRARGLPDLVLVPLAFAGNRGDMPRVGTFAAPAP